MRATPAHHARGLLLGGAAILGTTTCGIFVSYDGFHEAAATGTAATGTGGAAGGAGAGGTGTAAAGAGTSTSAGGDGGGCEAGMTLCGAACVNTDVSMSNCGACGAVCSVASPSTAVCQEGRCLATLASVAGNTGHLAVDGTNVYWTNPVAGTISKVPTAGGSAVTLVSSNVPGRIAVNPTHVVWEEDSNCGCASLHRVGIDGSNPMLIGASGQLSTLSVDATNAYYNAGYVVWRMPIAGGAAVQLAPLIDYGRSITSDATNVYYTAGGDVAKVPIAGGMATKLAWNQGSASGIGVTPTYVYWVGTGPALMRVPIGGGAWETVVSPWSVTEFVIDNSYAYGTNNGNLEKAPLAGGASQPVHAGVGTEIRIDSKSVYWLEDGPGVGKVMKLTPK